MSPAIRDGDLITVGPVAAASFTLGSVIVYRRGQRVLAHRLVGVQTDGGEEFRLVLRGDAMDTCDAPVTLAQVLGKVVTIHRSSLLQNPRGAAASLRRALQVGGLCAGRLVACGLVSVAERLKKRT